MRAKNKIPCHGDLWSPRNRGLKSLEEKFKRHLICYRLDADISPFAAFVLELNQAANLGKQGVIFAQSDIQSGLETRAALSHQDGAARNQLSGESLDAKALRIGIAPVSRTAYPFFVSHTVPLKT
jgi:hypothetical protein